MMKNKNDFYSPPNHRKWLQLGFSLILALFLFLIPLTLGGRISWGPLSDLSLPLGVTLVRATNGLTITKSAPALAGQGQPITYTLRITNNTGQDLTEGAVADTLPNDVNPATCQNIQAPAGWIFVCDGGTAVWALVENISQPLLDGSTVTLRFRVNTTSPLDDGHEIVNDDYEISAQGFTDNGPLVTTTIAGPRWAITKTASSETIKPGQNLVYTITATNIGQGATSGVYTITDTLPNNTTLVTPASLTWTFSAAVAPLGTRKVSYTVKVNSPLPNGLQIINDGYTVSGGGAPDPAVNDPINVTVVSTSTLNITKIASADPVRVGHTLRYTITLANNVSTGSAEGVVITDILPPQVTFQSATPPGTFAHSNGVVVWNLPDIPPDDSTQVTVSALVTTTLPDPRVITNTYQAAADNANPVAGTLATDVRADTASVVNLVIDPTTISVCETAVATVTVTDQYGNPVPGGRPVDILVGGAGDVTVSPNSGVTNQDSMFVTQIQGTDNGPVNILATSNNLSSLSVPMSVSAPAIPTSLTLAASPNPLLTGGNTALVTATLRDCNGDPVSGENLTFTLNNPALATFSGSTGGTSNANGVVTTTLTSNSTASAGTLVITGTAGALVQTTSLNVLPPNTPLLAITKSASPATGSTIETGETLIYTITVANNGTGAAANLAITDNLHVGVDFAGGNITSGSGPAVTGKRVTFSLPNLAINASTTATISVTVTSAVSGTTLSNVARARGSNTGLVTSNIVTHTVTTSTLTTEREIYLPIIYKD